MAEKVKIKNVVGYSINRKDKPVLSGKRGEVVEVSEADAKDLIDAKVAVPVKADPDAEKEAAEKEAAEKEAAEKEAAEKEAAEKAAADKAKKK